MKYLPDLDRVMATLVASMPHEAPWDDFETSLPEDVYDAMVDAIVARMV